MNKALITGVWGQDGSYLAELLFEKGYDVHGVARYPLSEKASKIKRHLERKGCKITEHNCNLLSMAEVTELLAVLKPDKVYHLAADHYSAQHPVDQKLHQDSSTFTNNVSPAAHLLEGIRKVCPRTRFVAAGSSLIFESADMSPQNEATPCRADSIYGLSKIIIRKMVGYYRKKQRVHASVAILYNHESPRRGDDFFTKKIVKNLIAVQRGEIEKFSIGNLFDVKDWGYAREYMHGIWLMSQQAQPADYIIASGKGHPLQTFLEYTADILHITDWWKHINMGNQPITRHCAVPLVGDATLARVMLQWSPITGLRQLVRNMVENELSNNLD